MLAAYLIPIFLFKFIWQLTTSCVQLSSSLTWPFSSYCSLPLQMYLQLLPYIHKTPAQDKLVYLLFPEHIIHILSTFGALFKPFPSVYLLSLYLSWRRSLSATSLRKPSQLSPYQRIHTYSYPHGTPPSLYSSGKYCLNNHVVFTSYYIIHCYTTHILFPLPKVKDQAYCLFLFPETRTKKYSINTVANNVDVMLMDPLETKTRVEPLRKLLATKNTSLSHWKQPITFLNLSNRYKSNLYHVFTDNHQFPHSFMVITFILVYIS